MKCVTYHPQCGPSFAEKRYTAKRLRGKAGRGEMCWVCPKSGRRFAVITDWQYEKDQK